MVVRGFLSYLATVVPGTEVPPSRIVAGAARRRPYIFTEDEMAALIIAAARANPRVPFRPTVLSTLLALLASTSLRVGEAVRLVTSNVRLEDAYPNLEILQTKFQKSRLVPIHRTVARLTSTTLGVGLPDRRKT
jgi:integrase/recombinase XerD